MRGRALFLLLLITFACWADTAGPASGTVTGTGWTTPSNATASDDAYASISISALGTAHIYISSLGFSIPGGSTINGITVTYERKCSVTVSCNTDPANGGTVSVSKTTAGSSDCDEKGTAGTWGTSDVTDTWGSGSDLWTCSWAASDINGSNFGFNTIVFNSHGSLARTASIDYLAVTVTYTPGGAGHFGRRALRSGWDPSNKAFCWMTGAGLRCAQTRSSRS